MNGFIPGDGVDAAIPPTDAHPTTPRAFHDLLVGLHQLALRLMDLAEVELSADARAVSVDAALGLAAVTLSGASLLLLDLALAAALAVPLGAPLALALTGLLNATAGAVLGGYVLQRLRGRHVLRVTRNQLRMSSDHLVRSLASPLH